MKIKKIRLYNFKRFNDLTIDEIPETAKLVVLIGANGCGKSSLFDAFKYFYQVKTTNLYNNMDYYVKNKEIDDAKYHSRMVDVYFYDDNSFFSESSQQLERLSQGGVFYFRTAYRNSPEINLTRSNRLGTPERLDTNLKMINNDSQVEQNYQRLYDEIISAYNNSNNNNITFGEHKQELLGKIHNALHNIFPELSFIDFGLMTEKADFYFSKGNVEKYSYQNLSGGEKAVFDLLLDIVVKKDYYQDTIFCIDEPESHIHTNAQAKLLHELFKLIPDNSQLWIATHSFGMMKEAKRLMETHPDEIVFLNFDNNYNFDQETIITPSSNCDFILWNKIKEICFGDYADFILPEKIVLCEGTDSARESRINFDKRCYENIFKKQYPNVVFYSWKNCEDINKEEQLLKFIQLLSPQTEIIRLIDRDDRSSEEIEDSNQKGVRVLSCRHLESYLLDDEVLKKWCDSVNKSDKKQDLLNIKTRALEESKSRGNAPDDFKSAANDICTKGQKLLGLTQRGNNGDAIMRDTLSKLITPDMNVYKELERDIFLPLEKTEQV
ncbi:MAG: AAA family ATPase [Neisseriaceae bacterium]|nr:AAA family ATPase [Neisseriaceae bacterium]